MTEGRRCPPPLLDARGPGGARAARRPVIVLAGAAAAWLGLAVGPWLAGAEVVQDRAGPAAFERVRALAMSADGANLWLGARTGLFRSQDRGRTWRRVALAPSRPNAEVTAVAVGPEGSRVLLVGTREIGVLRSRDGGRTWSGVTAALGDLAVHGLALDPTAPARLYAAVRDRGAGIYRSTDGGDSWTRMTDGPDGEVEVLTSVNLPSGMGGILLFAGTSRGLFRSPDCF